MENLHCFKKEQIVAPLDYNQKTYLEQFYKKYGKGFEKSVRWGFCGSSGITNYFIEINYQKIDKVGFEKKTTLLNYYLKNNLSFSRDSLVPGKKYEIKFFKVMPPELPSEEVIIFLKKENTLFVGMPGLMLPYDLTKSDIFFGYSTPIISFDDSAYRSELYQYSDCIHTFRLYNNPDNLKEGDIVICFVEC